MEYTEADHLVSKEPVVSVIFDALIEKLHAFGELKIEPKKTSIHLVNRFAFAGVYTRKDYINLEFQLSHKLIGKRILKVEQVSANRFHHTVKISSTKELDRELLGWLKDAYDLKK
jgi:hypothetical protein